MSTFLDAWLQLGSAIPAYFNHHHAWVPHATLAVFTTINSIRIFAYVPQIVKAVRDTNGASAISFTTWGLFLVSHLATIAYALVCVGDLLMTLIFTGNALACAAILVVTACKRRGHALRTSPFPMREPGLPTT